MAQQGRNKALDELYERNYGFDVDMYLRPMAMEWAKNPGNTRLFSDFVSRYHANYISGKFGKKDENLKKMFAKGEEDASMGAMQTKEFYNLLETLKNTDFKSEDDLGAGTESRAAFDEIYDAWRYEKKKDKPIEDTLIDEFSKEEPIY
tara:strand:- start:411 stop:854 length:444 start_codon:yes stop_codon:yes gene_type:complete